MSELKALEDAMNLAVAHYSDVKYAKSEEYRTLLQVEEHRISKEMSRKHDAGIASARMLADIARERYEAARVALAEAGHDAPFPLGTTMIQWASRSRYHTTPREPTGLKGVVEVFKAGDAFHSSSWRMPEPGDFVIRHIKKDGTPSMKATPMKSGYGYEWFPDGVKPLR